MARKQTASTIEVTPEPNPLLADARKAYMAELEQAREAAKTTATEGWQALYGHFVEQQKDACREVAERLIDIAKSIESANYDEDAEKAVGEEKKVLTARREEREIFDRKTVSPIRTPVERCCEIINDYLNDAEKIESSEPLIHRNALTEMEAEIATWPKAKWDSKTGTVTIAE